MTIQSILDLVLDTCVPSRGLLVSHSGSEGCGQVEGVLESHSVPEEVIRSDLLPEVTSVLWPVACDPFDIVLDRSTIVGAGSSPEVLSNVVTLAVIEKSVREHDQGSGSEGWSISLGSAPGPRVD